MNPRFALFLIAACALPLGAAAQIDLKNTPSTAACPSAAEVSAVYLYGLWRAEWADGGTPTELHLTRHPEMADSVRGTLSRDGATAQLAGDVDNGDFTLEESDNGRNISATWTGRVADTSCGKEIQGTWTNATNSTERRFVLRKQPPWR